MSYFKVNVFQTATNATAEIVFPTGLTIDGRTGWNILGVRWESVNLYNVVPVTANSKIECQVNTETGNQSPMDADNILNICLQYKGTAASTAAFQMQSQGTIPLVAPRLTVQPNLYFHLETAGLTAAASLVLTVDYDVVKLTDLEVMRLYQGGA